MPIRNTAHAQRMHDFLAQPPFDPREPPVEPVRSGYYLEFRKHLRASEQMGVLCRYLAHVCNLFDGLKREVADVLPPTHTQSQAAELAVRWCSPEYRHVATTAAENYLVTELELLDAKFRSCDVTEHDKERLLKQTARLTVETYLFHLLNETGRSAHEWKQHREVEEGL